MAILEGLWDCSNCLTTGIPGHLKTCPKCGDPRNPTLDPEEKPYLPRDARVVTDKEELDLANAGVDWNCGHCGEANRGDATKCAHCGRRRDGDDVYGSTTQYVGGESAKGVTLSDPDQETADRADILVPDPVVAAERVISDQADQPIGPRSYTRSEDSLPRKGAIAGRAEEEQAIIDAKRAVRERGLWPVIWERQRTKVLVGGGALVALLVVVFGVRFIYSTYFETTAVKLTVTDLTWSRSVEVQELRNLTEQDWQIPSGGSYVREFSAVHHYNHVLDHYEQQGHTEYRDVYDGEETYNYDCGTVDKGNGFFETQTCTGSRPKYRSEAYTVYEQVAVYRDDPVYATKYEYIIDRWVFDRWETAIGSAGETGPKPVWPEPRGLDATHRVGDGRQATYVVVMTDKKDKMYREEPGIDIWSSLHKGDEVTAHVTKQGDVRKLDWPVPTNK